MTRLSDLGESQVLSRILQHTQSGSHVIIGPGDDAAVTSVQGNLVSTVDMLVENEDFTTQWLDWSKLGVKAAAQNLADVCAMGARPHGLLVSLAVPDTTDIADLEALFKGIVDEAGRAGAALACEVPVIGGDLSSSGLITIAITALGTIDTTAITRSGAQPGDDVLLAGTIGQAAAGLDLLFAGVSGSDLSAELSALIECQMAPQPDYSAIPTIVDLASAMIDVSDGLSTDLGRVGEASGVHARIEAESLRPCIEPLLPAAHYLLGADANRAEAERMALSWVLGGGEDHGFIATSARATPAPVGWHRIGKVTTGRGVSLDGEPVPASGFSHFGK